MGFNTNSAGVLPAADTGKAQTKPIYMPNEVLVVLTDTASVSLGTSAFSLFPLRVIKAIDSHWATIYRLGITDGTSVEQMVGKLKLNSNVRIVEPNYILNFLEAPYNPNDPMWNPANPGTDPRSNMWAQWGPAKLGASIVWNESKGDPNVIVAVIDTGVRRTHEDLENNLWINTDEIEDNGIDDDNNGYIDDWWGWNCFEGNNIPFDTNSGNYYHGTGCAGVIAATQNNGKGISGIAPGCKVMAIRADMNDGSTCESTVCEALNYAKDNGAAIISMSFGVIYATEILDQETAAIWDNGNGPIMLASAGNEDNTNVYSPARCDSVIAVGATIPWSGGGGPVDEGRIHNGWNGWWWGSTYGPKLHIMGFGERTYSTYGSGDNQYWDGVNHWFFNGTSCACPTTAGVMALVMSFHPGETGQWYWDRIQDTSDDLDVPGFDDQTGWGRVNALRAVYGSDRYSAWEDGDGFVRVSLDSTSAAFNQPLYDSIHDVSPSNSFADTQDLYKITCGLDATFRIYLDIFTWGEDLDMELYSDKAMTDLIQSSTGPNHATSSFHEMTVDGQALMSYYLKVYSPALGNSTMYGLTMEYL
jgi:thermitase